MTRAHLACACACAAACLAACQSFPDPPVTFVAGLRVLGTKAEPPEVAPGSTSTVSVLAVDTTGGTIAATWSACLLPPLPGDAVNSDCLTATSGSFVQPIGDGLTIAATMPQVTAASLGAPDVTGGVYLPLVARVTSAGDALNVVHRLRLLQAAPANANPAIASVIASVVGRSAGATAPLEEGNPLPVSAGDVLALSVTFASGSAESYTRADGTTTTETLTTSWFCTAGTLSVQKTSATQPESLLHFDQHLPAAGSTIDLWAVARDERGGTDYTHRTLSFR